ncbi:MAG TPA: hypothetical protein VNG90_00940 [Candidatus Acidoferrum sp.]|nr:hypothetical protein [Candidatus Acidoferrum sp.]
MVDALETRVASVTVAPTAPHETLSGYKFLFLINSWNHWGMYSPEKLTEKLQKALADYTACHNLPMPGEVIIIEDRPRGMARIQLVIYEGERVFREITAQAAEWESYLRELICLPDFGRSFCGAGFYRLDYENYCRV